jgi:hypothetical protein
MVVFLVLLCLAFYAFGYFDEVNIDSEEKNIEIN